MIKPLRIGPWRQELFALLHEFLLEISQRLAVIRITRGHHTTLARVVADEFYRSDLERFQFLRRAVEPILAKRLALPQLKIGAETAPQTFHGQLRKPCLDFMQAGLRGNRGAKCDVIIRKSLTGIVAQFDRKSKKIREKSRNGRWFVQRKLGAGGAAVPKAHFPELRVEFTAQLMNPRKPLAIHDAARGVKNGPATVMLQNAAARQPGFGYRNSVQGFDGEDLDLVETHRTLNTGANRRRATKIRENSHFNIAWGRMPGMISLAEARRLITEKISPLPAVSVPLSELRGGVLRQDVKAREDLPGFDRSAMDGYAIAANDASAKFRIVATIEPGPLPKCKIRRGQCARIFTGAPVPAGASQVLMQEDTRLEGEFMAPTRRDKETNIRYRGEDARRGAVLLKQGTRLGPGELALLAGLGAAQVQVSPPVRVAHLATGNELVAPGEKLRPGQIRDSNSTLVAALTRQFGGELVKQERVPDDFKLLLKRARALQKSFDLLLISGGASVGDFDFGKRLLTELDFKIHFTASNLRPGKPLVFATKGRQAAFVLPGNPVSHWVTMQVEVRAAFERFSGAPVSWPLAKVRLAKPFAYRAGPRETFLPGRLEVDPRGGLVVRALRWQSSGDVTGLAGVNALLHLAAGTQAPKAGDPISVLILNMP